jgi:cytochrome P450
LISTGERYHTLAAVLRQRTALPPGPKLPAPVQLLRFYRDPVGFLNDCHRRYGRMFTVRLTGFGTLVYAAEPELARRIFAGDPALFRAGDSSAFMAPVLGRGSLLILDGVAHARERKLLQPAFHGERIRRLVAGIDDLVAAEVAGWPRGAAFALRPRLQALTLKIILGALLGDGPRRPALERAVEALTRRGALSVALGATTPDLGDWTPAGQTRLQLDELDRLLAAEIAARRADGDRTGRADILSLLIDARHDGGTGLDDRQLRDHLVTLMFAGHETSATTLAWAFERLVRAPAAMERLRAEALAGAGDAWADAVVRETLRVRTCISDVGRVLAAPLELDGWRLPAGVSLLAAIVVVHRSPELWPDPERFAPERFLHGAPEPMAWIPFGGGVRRCIGAALAQAEIKAVLTSVVRRVRLRAADPRSEAARLHAITIVPEHGARVILEEAS